MASNTERELLSYPIISERVTNLNDQYADLVYCPICSHILWKPVTCNSCENSFCFQCIQIWLFEQQEQSFSFPRCPFNCSPYKERKCPPLLISILSKLTIECRNKSYGCQKILLYEQLEKHEEDFCQYKIVQCPGCKQNMFREMFEKNEHLLKCLYMEFQCIKCQSIFQRKDKHDQFDCIEKQIYLLRENILIFQQKFSEILDIQRKKIEILDEKITVIGDIWGNDDDESIDIHINSIPTSSQLFSFRSMKTWKIILIILCLFIYITIYLY
jgi:hypothetical protein